ncbi:MAG: LuxR family transcriptional regulator [Candidatus Wallbacteria bacterium HGW-Wallbacteria-1]|jgi:D-ornithine 4,5-aminomutase subunit beta|uniref:LuxR family transcriptional regulator n=1 Tax=Candidatus Wallbacteria bacterium HGW-Wallbacteria-1 TaxID=2013854 RepID=A0A2N1PLQ0_9BACT|nr:MAG: LuxR family transcriptional regulator [Candidatus Wallbacteria bacterium HGW-Wallbacteria-1]
MSGIRKLDPMVKIDVDDILRDLDKYRPRRWGWTWRTHVPGLKMHKHVYHDCTTPLKNSVPLPAAKYFDGIDPQPMPVITTEIASGRFEDDIRRMRMAAWHGADHIMVIRTMGQSHFDGLIEGTPEGVGGVPITRKQLRATRKALDLIEDEVGRPINFHSYVSGVAGPEVAVLFAEEAVNGAHQDPQYNVLYRNINMIRSFVDCFEAKKVMSGASIFQIDGAHNANATAREAWNVMPELMVQHAINCAVSMKAGMVSDLVGLSTVPPNSPPAPKLWYDLPYAVALREFFSEYRMRAQQNTRYIESDIEEATRTHVIDTLISALTRADIQSTITPDEGRNVPWHYNNIRGIETAKQTLVALDGIKQLVKLADDGPLRDMIRNIKERAVMFLEDMIEMGGYFSAVEKGFFVDSGLYPERNGDGIARQITGGVGAGTVVLRDPDYFAPVCSHFGNNNIPAGLEGQTRICDCVGGCTICNHDLIPYIDELDQEDNADHRLETLREDRAANVTTPEVEWHADGKVLLSVFFPEPEMVAMAAAEEMAKNMGLEDVQVVHRAVMHPVEGTFMEVRGVYRARIDKGTLKIPEKIEHLDDQIIRDCFKAENLTIVGGTVGSDEHSVGMREIIDIKHGGLEKWGVKCHYIGTSVPLDKMVDAAIETGSRAILISTIISHNDVHLTNMRKLHELCIEKGIRDRIMLISGGTQVTSDLAVAAGMDAGFGRGSKGIDVADFMARRLLKITQ